MKPMSSVLLLGRTISRPMIVQGDNQAERVPGMIQD